MLQIETAADFMRVSVEVRGLVPVSFGAFLLGVSDTALRDRLRRGSLRSWSVGGGLFVSVVELSRRGVGGRPKTP